MTSSKEIKISQDLSKSISNLTKIAEKQNKSITALSKTMDDLALMTMKGFESTDEKFSLSDRWLQKIDQRFVEVDGGFEAMGSRFVDLRQELHNFRMETKDDLVLIKQNFTDDFSGAVKMSKEDIDAYGQDIVAIKKKQRELENKIKKLQLQFGK